MNMVNTAAKVNLNFKNPSDRTAKTMKNIIVQIYEIQTPQEAAQVLALGADHVGSVLLSEDEWKKPEIRETVAAVTAAGAVSSLIPLFSTEDTVFRALDYYGPRIVHFCENLVGETGISPDCGKWIRLQENIKKRFPEIRIMRAVPIAEPGKGSRIPSLELARQFEDVSDFFLTDTLLLPDSGRAASGEQPVKNFVGITGKICDWDIAARLVKNSRIPVILAGGLGPDNVAAGIARTNPAGVDSCTATNAADREGKPVRFSKDMDKVRKFVEAVRNSQNIFS